MAKFEATLLRPCQAVRRAQDHPHWGGSQKRIGEASTKIKLQNTQDTTTYIPHIILRALI